MNADRWIALISLVITVGALIFAVWAFRRGEKRRVPTVAVRDALTTVAPFLHQVTGFSVTFNGKRITDHGVYTQSVYFWNDGQLPILRSDITSPYTFSFPKGVRILFVNVTRQTRPILDVKAEVASNGDVDSVVIGFSVLEPGDGLQLHIIFDGPRDSPINFAGSCIGSARVKVLSRDYIYFINRKKRLTNTLTQTGFILVGSITAVAISILFFWVGMSAKHPGRLSIRFLLLWGVLYAISAAIGVGLFNWYKRGTASSVPPELQSRTEDS